MNEQKGVKIIMNISYRIVSMLYIKKDIIESRTYSFCTCKLVSKDIINIDDRIADFKVFKEEFVNNEIICTKIQNSISLWEECLETVIENNEKTCSNENNSYCWLIYYGLKNKSQ